MGRRVVSTSSLGGLSETPTQDGHGVVARNAGEGEKYGLGASESSAGAATAASGFAAMEAEAKKSDL